MAVVDASVIAASFIRAELMHERCVRWLRGEVDAGIDVHVPSILLPEVAHAIQMRGDDAGNAIAILLGLLRLRVVDVSSALAERSAGIAAANRIRGCDAVYVALAEHLGTELVTLDRQQRERGASVVPTREP